MTHAGNKSFKLGLLSGAVIGFMLALPAAILAVRVVNAPADYAAVLYKDGFNFELLRDEKNYHSSLKSGAKIDTTQFRAEDGTDLKTAIGGRGEPVMLLAYDPKCSFCRKADVQIRGVNEHLSSAGVRYFFVSFSADQNRPRFYGTAKALGADGPSFVWDGPGADSDFSFGVQTPSHILIDSDGTILRVWPGVLEESEAQERMANQIVADTRAILDALGALRGRTALAASGQPGSSPPGGRSASQPTTGAH
ncbi:MAG: thioredoxin family protein [Acidobacteriota bacterium]|nr:thioredoxin family protein [Acidobacteriota bacterium]